MYFQTRYDTLEIERVSESCIERGDLNENHYCTGFI